MTDNLRRYCAIQKALKSLRSTEPKGNVARHLNTLAMFIAGIIGSQKCHLPAIAKKVPVGGKPQSRIRRLERFVPKNEAFDLGELLSICGDCNPVYLQIRHLKRTPF